MDQQRYTAEPSHLAQLRKFVPNYKDISAADRADFTRTLDQAEHFVFTAVPDIDEEIAASARAMGEAGVWRLPYPTCTFEFSAKLSIRGIDKFDGAGFRLIVVCTTEDDGSPAIKGAFIRAALHDPRSWILTRWSRVDGQGALVNYEKTVDADRIITTSDLEVPPELRDEMIFDDGGEALRVERPEGYVRFDFSTDREQSDVASAVATCLVMLATRGIRREKWIGNKPVLLHRPIPQNAYTRVMVAEAVDEGHGTRPDCAARYRVRLHMRRGHTRNQPHGPGRKFTRKIWIAPCLVGYEDEGRITHDHYETYPHKEPTP